MRFLSSLILLCVVASSQARLGETPIQFADRYGSPRDSVQDKHPSPYTDLIENATHHTYEYQGWRIRAAFLQLDGAAVRVDYSKVSGTGVNPIIQDYELQAIAAANTPNGMSWTRTSVTNPNISPLNIPARFFQNTLSNAVGEAMWQRTDGATLWLRPGKMFARLELPAAGEYEAQLKAAKEQKARASVPKF